MGLFNGKVNFRKWLKPYLSVIKTDIADEVSAIQGQLSSKLNEDNWFYYVTTWSVKPTLNASLPIGRVFNYTLNGVTRYRFVPTIYDPTLDAFYSNFDGTNLTGLIIKRG